MILWSELHRLVSYEFRVSPGWTYGASPPVMLSVLRTTARSSYSLRTKKRRMSTHSFVDYFGAQVGAANYAQARPTYPPAFLDSIVAMCSVQPQTIIDIGCGTGQATFYLASKAEKVIGMDPSEGQVKEAIVQAEKLGSDATRIRFVQGGAEDLSVAGVAPSSVDLITAAQCAHWFNLPIFYEQAKTYLRPNGTLALWCYTRPTIANCPEMEEALRKFYTETIGPHWPASRKMIDDKYEAINPPYGTVTKFDTTMEYELNRKGLIDYLGTWSALQVAKKVDPQRDWLLELNQALDKQSSDTVFKMVTPIYAVVAKL